MSQGRIWVRGLVLGATFGILVTLLGGCKAQAGFGTKGAQPEETLTVAFLELSDLPRDLALVEAEVNRRYAGAVGARIRLLPIHEANWSEAVASLLAEDPSPDLLMQGGVAFKLRANRGLFLPLDSLLEHGGRAVLETLDPVYLKPGRVDGKIYAVPSLHAMATGYGFVAQAEIAQACGLDLREVHTLEDLGAALAQVKAKRPDLVPIMHENHSSGPLVFGQEFDSLGDDLGVLRRFSGKPKVVDLFSSPEYAAFVARMRSWNRKGLLESSGATNRESPEDRLRAGEIFASFYHITPGIDSQLSRVTSRKIVAVSLSQAQASTSTAGSTMWTIPKASRRPEKAMAFLNLLYSDPGLVNLLDWGLEGRHYVKTPEGLIDYPPGVDGRTSGYNPNHGWGFGNQFLSYVFAGDSPSLWAETAAFNRAAAKSPALGFSYVSQETRGEYAALRETMATYRWGLEYGALDPEKYLPVFLHALKAAGIEKVIQEKQEALDLWLPSSGAP